MVLCSASHGLRLTMGTGSGANVMDIRSWSSGADSLQRVAHLSGHAGPVRPPTYVWRRGGVKGLRQRKDWRHANSQENSSIVSSCHKSRERQREEEWQPSIKVDITYLLSLEG
jgi:hypothetical protein